MTKKRTDDKLTEIKDPIVYVAVVAIYVCVYMTLVWTAGTILGNSVEHEPTSLSTAALHTLSMFIYAILSRSNYVYTGNYNR